MVKEPLGDVRRDLQWMSAILIVLGPVWSINAQENAVDAATVGVRAVELLKMGELRRGGELLRKAIPLSAARKAPPEEAKASRLMAAAIRHGENQLRRMREDRPAMKRIGKPDDELWVWAVEAFAGSTCGALVEWDSDPPDVPSALCQFFGPVGYLPGRIRVRKGKDGDISEPARIWAGLVFELHNIGHFSKISSVYDRAYKGDISERDFVKEIFLQEYRAITETRAFYAHVFLPHAIDHGLATSPDSWYMNEQFWYWKDAEEAFADFTDKHQYPWVPYRRYYWGFRLARFKEFILNVVEVWRAEISSYLWPN